MGMPRLVPPLRSSAGHVRCVEGRRVVAVGDARQSGVFQKAAERSQEGILTHLNRAPGQCRGEVVQRLLGLELEESAQDAHVLRQSRVEAHDDGAVVLYEPQLADVLAAEMGTKVEVAVKCDVSLTVGVDADDNFRLHSRFPLLCGLKLQMENHM
jgi:hypothetical protein